MRFLGHIHAIDGDRETQEKHPLKNEGSKDARLCLEMDENIRHVLLECGLIARIRVKVFETGFLNSSVIRKAEPKKIYEFFRKLQKRL